MDFKKIDNSYRAIPFWSWNEKLNTEETRRQVKVMDEAGIGGYFMHARGGLLTEYMGDEWFDNVYAACDEGEKRGMRSWAYDENGWPSGFGDGRLLKLGEDYLLKALTYKRTENYDDKAERVLLEKDGYTYYYHGRLFTYGVFVNNDNQLEEYEIEIDLVTGEYRRIPKILLQTM